MYRQSILSGILNPAYSVSFLKVADNGNGHATERGPADRPVDRQDSKVVVVNCEHVVCLC